MVLAHRHDWLPYVGVPALGSATLIVGANGLISEKSFAPYAIAGAMVLLLFAGIYGAWGPRVVDDQERKNTERRVASVAAAYELVGPVGLGSASRSLIRKRT
jgi:hypothetical protein